MTAGSSAAAMTSLVSATGSSTRPSGPTASTRSIDRVNAAGMQFGLWFEGEMVNVDSDLYRAHPEWIFQAGGRIPPEGRHQQVLDLGHQGAYEPRAGPG